MTKAYISRDILKTVNKIIYQNDAECIDCYEGCLLDNMLFSARRGIFALYETYVNSNMSKYLFKFASDEQEISELWDEFIQNRNRSEQEDD